jgi:hypothetical protein
MRLWGEMAGVRGYRLIWLEIPKSYRCGTLPAQSPLKFDFKSRYRRLVPRIEFDALRRDLSA